MAVTAQIEGGIARIIIDNPPVNALNQAVLEDLLVATAKIAADPSVRVAIISGAGRKAFVAGADIAQMSKFGTQQAAEFAALGHRAFAAIEALPCPVIAQVQGYCLGGGCELSLACDLVYAGERARFGQPEVNLGLIPGFGGTQRLGRRIGPMRAAELIYSGRMIKADEAKRIGLCLEVFAQDELTEQVDAVAQQIASRGPIAVRTAKRVQALGLEAPLATANAFEQQAFAVLFDAADTKEGMTAFLEKRDPNFQNG